jgi:hypothetical protein
VLLKEKKSLFKNTSNSIIMLFMLKIIMMMILNLIGRWSKKVLKISLKKLILSKNNVFLPIEWFYKEGK